MKLHEYIAAEIIKGTKRHFARLEQDYIAEQISTAENTSLTPQRQPRPQPKKK